MPRIRTLKPEVWDSPDIMALSVGARLTFIGLITQADDQGRVCETLPKLTGILHPSGDVPTDQVADWIDELIKQGVVTAAAWKRRLVLHVNGWEDHQRVDHPKDPRLPEPDGEMDGCESVVLESCRANLDVPRESRESLGKSSRESPKSDRVDHGIVGTVGSGDLEEHADDSVGLDLEVQEPEQDQFEEFWETYPRHDKSGKPGGGGSKAKSRKLWDKLEPDEQQAALVGVGHYADFQSRDDAPFTCHATTWLNERRWETWQEPAEKARGSPGPRQTDTFDKTEEF